MHLHRYSRSTLVDGPMLYWTLANIWLKLLSEITNFMVFWNLLLLNSPEDMNWTLIIGWENILKKKQLHVS